MSDGDSPVPVLRKIMPEMPLDDVPAGVAHYRDVLGFQVDYQQYDIGVMDRDDVRLLLIARTEAHRGIGSAYVYVADADALHAELTAKGAGVQGPPVSRPWGLREFEVVDPEGNRITFGEPFEPVVPHDVRVEDPDFVEAIAAMDAGDTGALERLLAERPRLLRDRLPMPEEGYFRHPYLLWFVAENPVRSGRLPPDAPEVARAIVRGAVREGVESLPEQLDHALLLVSSGHVPRECGVQRALIDALVDAGARPDGALGAALAHRETAAVERLLERGAAVTLAAAACLRREEDVERLAREAGPEERQAALCAAAFFGDAAAVARLLGMGADPRAFCPEGFHPHATALHHAVDAGSLEAVRILVEAGADLEARDRVYGGTPRGWAEHLGRDEVAAYLMEKHRGGSRAPGTRPNGSSLPALRVDPATPTTNR